MRDIHAPAGFEPRNPKKRVATDRYVDSQWPKTATLTASDQTAPLSPLRTRAEILQAALKLNTQEFCTYYVVYNFSRRMCVRPLHSVVICKGQARSV